LRHLTAYARNPGSKRRAPQLDPMRKFGMTRSDGV
jgi:hypothetical protein